MRLCLLLCTLFATLTAVAQSDTHLKALPLENVTLLDSPFKRAEQLDIRYLLTLDADRLLAPYRKEAGLQPKAENYPNWENTGLDGHIGGHYLSALAQMYASTKNTEIGKRMNYMLDELEQCQSDDGYLGGVPNGRKIWQEIASGDIRAGRFNLNGGWVPLYNIHKIFAGLRDAWHYTHDRRARRMLIALTDWMERTTLHLTDEQMQQMLYSEHGGLNEIFADVAALTNDKRYLRLAHRFSDNELLKPLLRGEDRLTGMHANTQIPKVIGYKRIAEVEGLTDWAQAAEYFWQQVVGHRTISIGGNSVREHFHPHTDFSSMLTSEQGPETCNTYNMLRLSKMLYCTSDEGRYIDYYEQALYNHILSSQHPEQGGLVYFTPMRAGHYRVYSQPHTSFWCCVGSGMENHARYGELIYAERKGELTVNLFIPSEARWQGGLIRQTTAFPEEEATTLTLIPKRNGARFRLRVRIPSWCKVEQMQLTLNGQPIEKLIEGDYLVIDRRWQRGDCIKVTLPMALRAVAMPDQSANYSFMYGPIVLAASLGEEDQEGLFADESRGGHIAAGPRLSLDQMPCLVGEPHTLLDHIRPTDQPLTFTLHGLYPATYEGMTLRPFHQLYACRYMVYWPLLSADELAAFQAELAAKEASAAALQQATTDVVYCGEQQPESDHFIASTDALTGDDEGRHWRRTRTSFSYQLKTDNGAARHLRIAYRAEFLFDATVRINGEKVATLVDTDEGRDAVAMISIPSALRSLERLTITIERAGHHTTPAIYEVRVVR